MPYTKNVSTVRTATVATEASYRYFLSDAKDDSPADHPLCLCCEVTVHPSDVQTVRLESVVRDVDGKVTGRVAAAPFSQAQVNAIKTSCGIVYNAAVTASGYTNTP